MAEIQRNTPDGRWQIYGWRQAEMEYAARLGAQLARGGEVVADFVDFDGEPAYLKASPLRPGPSRRHAWRRRLLRVPPPRLAEYWNLSWMTERHFRCPLPLASGALWQGGRPRYQFLATRTVADAEDLRTFLTRTTGEGARERRDVLAELARELARLHALHFVHRDLYPRNLLVAPPEAGRRVVFLDAWRGGERLQTRGAAHDLGCLFLDARELFTAAEAAAFWRDYADERSAQGRPVPRRFARAVERARDVEWRKLRRDPARLRGAALPPREWTAPLHSA